ncbi:MAG TPA: PAS domain-containing protein [Thermoleophilia bacterium]|nr:PAS domain-containing protein [Thermoleophilia bacterium]
MPSRRIPSTLATATGHDARQVLFVSPEGAGVTPPPLTYSDPRLRAFLSVTFDILYDWNMRSGAIYFGEQLDAVLGQRPGAFPRHISGWFDRLHPDDREHVAEAIGESVARHTPFRCEYRLRHDDASYRLMSDHGVILTDEAGEPASMIGVMRDVTGERAAQIAAHEAQRAMQEELERTARALRRQTTILDERNAALRVLLEQREQDRLELEQRIVGNVERLIDPSLDRLSRALRHHPERLEVEAVRHNLREVVSPFAERLAGRHAAGPPLTRREIEVANLVRLGKTSAEIAEALHISPSSVAFHRANVRRKLGLPKGGPRLETHLAALGRD